MKGALLWLFAIGGGAAIGALGGTAWLVVQGDAEVPGVESTSVDDTRQGAEPSEVVETASPSLDDADAWAGNGISSGDGLEFGDEPLGLDPARTEREDASRDLPTSPVASASPSPSPQPTANHERLGRIFAAMKPAEAAAVLGQLDDAEVEGVLMTMPARNAAPILAELDPVRAASLSRRILGGRTP